MMKNKHFSFYIIVVILFSGISNLLARGISVDAGITPPQNRFIFRSQYRYMSMSNSMMGMNTNMIPMVLAYGATPGLSVMMRGIFIHRTFDHNTEIHNGLNDFFILTKYRLYRKNTSKYIVGIAPHLATNIPTGKNVFSNRTWNPEIGLNVSFRPRFFSFDVSTSLTFKDSFNKYPDIKGYVFNFNIAISALIPFKKATSNAISPVMELSYSTESYNNKELRNNKLLFISPGISFIHRSFALEALIQIPIFQYPLDNNSIIQNRRFILGIKYMF